LHALRIFNKRKGKDVKFAEVKNKTSEKELKEKKSLKIIEPVIRTENKLKFRNLMNREASVVNMVSNSRFEINKMKDRIQPKEISSNKNKHEDLLQYSTEEKLLKESRIEGLDTIYNKSSSKDSYIETRDESSISNLSERDFKSNTWDSKVLEDTLMNHEVITLFLKGPCGNNSCKVLEEVLSKKSQNFIENGKSLFSCEKSLEFTEAVEVEYHPPPCNTDF